MISIKMSWLMTPEMNQCSLGAIYYSVRMREELRGPDLSRESKKQQLRQALRPTHQFVTSCSYNPGPGTVKIPTEDSLKKLKMERAL